MTDTRKLIETVIETLNRAYAADPTATHMLFANRVPCSQAMADDPTIIVGLSNVKSQDGQSRWTVGMLGLLNGILTDLGCVGQACMAFDDAVGDGLGIFLGFGYTLPSGEVVRSWQGGAR